MKYFISNLTCNLVKKFTHRLYYNPGFLEYNTDINEYPTLVLPFPKQQSFIPKKQSTTVEDKLEYDYHVERNIRLSCKFIRINIWVLDYRCILSYGYLPSGLMKNSIGLPVYWNDIMSNPRTVFTTELLEWGIKYFYKNDWINMMSSKKITHIPLDFVKKYEDQVPWDKFLRDCPMEMKKLEQIVETFPNKVNWKIISHKQPLKSAFIYKYADRIHWCLLGGCNQKLSDEFIERNIQKLDFHRICLLHGVSRKLMTKYSRLLKRPVEQYFRHFINNRDPLDEI